MKTAEIQGFKEALIQQAKDGVPEVELVSKVVTTLKENVTLSHKQGGQVFEGLVSVLGLNVLERQYVRKHFKREFERQWKELS